ncbi:Mitochondrial carrier domain protein [Niveomyces insectorum RCEF 264]|uniref:Mitochondrial carrier domain protein n=1 Tax=Niveomyces insectorum RCEF 264 TaxID=1081102 RepID=A0A167RYA3_9HYPO|nr:Mitochondrial carrier domain protein [Niveomyces insectorum RCEF 264]
MPGEEPLPSGFAPRLHLIKQANSRLWHDHTALLRSLLEAGNHDQQRHQHPERLRERPQQRRPSLVPRPDRARPVPEAARDDSGWFGDNGGHDHGHDDGAWWPLGLGLGRDPILVPGHVPADDVRAAGVGRRQGQHRHGDNNNRRSVPLPHVLASLTSTPSSAMYDQPDTVPSSASTATIPDTTESPSIPPSPSVPSSTTPSPSLISPSTIRSDIPPPPPPPPTPPRSRSPSTTKSSSSSSPSSQAPVAAAAADIQPLTAFERWTLHASDSQFNALSGAIGGFTSGVFTCPLDVIKTKLQAQGGFTALQQAGRAGGQGHHHKVYNGLVGTARVIWQGEGIRGLYRGLGPIIMGYLPTWAVWFTVYNKSKLWMGERYHNTFVINFWSSIVAGASSTVVTNPIWVIKTRLMSQMPNNHDRPGYSPFPKGANTPTVRPTLHTPWHYDSTFDAARKMYTTEGILSFYSGLTPALLGLTHVAVQFPAYEYLKTRFTGRGMGESPGDGEAPAHWFGVLSATILSKILASSLTYPHEVIRTRLQTQRRPQNGVSVPAPGPGPGPGPHGTSAGQPQSPAPRTSATPSTARSPAQPPPPSPSPSPQATRYRGVVMTFRTILREEGWRAFYAGLGTNMMRAVPAATVTMLTYEYVMRSLKQTRHDAQQKLNGVL